LYHVDCLDILPEEGGEEGWFKCQTVAVTDLASVGNRFTTVLSFGKIERQAVAGTKLLAV